MASAPEPSMVEEEIRAEVETRHHQVDVIVDWLTPAGNRRSAPIYVADVSNEYLGRERELKAKTRRELEYKIHECLGKWNEQEIKKRVAAAKKDSKEQAQAETARLDQEAKVTLEELEGILEATLAVDDRIDWDSERDTRTYPPFTYASPPKPPTPTELVLPSAPGWMWLFRGRRKRWETECEEAESAHASEQAAQRARWEAAVEDHAKEREAAHKRHDDKREEFLADQEEFNEALAKFRRRFEANDEHAIQEYCSGVLERSLYPESLSIAHALEFEADSGIVLVNLELPSKDGIPGVSGFKFVAKGNRSEPIPLKKKELELLHDSILDQVAIRTMHELFEGCYTTSVQRVIVNAWVTSLNKATGQDEREQVRCIASDREPFEAIDLSRIEPAACVARLSEGIGRMSGAAR